MLGVVIRAVEVPISFSLRVAGMGISVAGRALAEVQRGLAPLKSDGRATGPETVQESAMGPETAQESAMGPETGQSAPPTQEVPEIREPAHEAGDASGTTVPGPREQAGSGEPAAEDVTARTPHSPLNYPVAEPDLTEWPDPYDRREDPRDPGEEMVFGEGAGHTYTGSTSTSEPHPSQDPEAEPWEGPKRDKVDE
ncbi:MAG: hypothetical protein JO321_17945 [Solirubrobacterales bacterium]|nr:hypothetical protein [Solirubrobacterales bacterium]